MKAVGKQVSLTIVNNNSSPTYHSIQGKYSQTFIVCIFFWDTYAREKAEESTSDRTEL